MGLRHGFFAIVMLLVSAAALCAQAPSAAAGLPPEWEARQMFEALNKSVARLQPIIDQIDPKQWNGSPSITSYLGQQKSAKDNVGYLRASATRLAATPESITQALDTLFRLQSVEGMVMSLADGVRRYQNPALADLLAGVLSENSSHSQKLRDYVIQLAATKEAEMKVIDQEAQRCRGTLSRQPVQTPAPPPAATKKEQPR